VSVRVPTILKLLVIFSPLLTGRSKSVSKVARWCCVLWPTLSPQMSSTLIVLLWGLSVIILLKVQSGSKFVYSRIVPISEGHTAVVGLNSKSHIAHVASWDVLETACGLRKVFATCWKENRTIRVIRLWIVCSFTGWTQASPEVLARVIASSVNLVAGVRVGRLLAGVLEIQHDSGNPVLRLDWYMT
jgi:hypothetical protein